MRRTVLAAVSAVLLAVAPAAAQDAAAEIPQVIQRQFDAFLQSDVEAAFGFASPNIRALFGTPERFGAMVQQGYPMVWRPSDVRFLDLREEGGLLWQRVRIRDEAGAVHFLDYQMVRTPMGWQINGVRFAEPDVGV
jgi:hypothetical protein